MKKLPFDKEERIKVIKDRVEMNVIDLNGSFSESDYAKNIELISNDRRIYFILDSPMFEYTYFEGDKAKVRSMTVDSIYISKQFFDHIGREYQNGRLYAFYSLSNNIIRGCFIDNLGDLIAEDRDKRIDDILS